MPRPRDDVPPTNGSATAAQGGDFLTLQEAADQLKVHYMTAYRWVRKGQLPAFKAGGRLRIRTDDLERFVVDRRVEVALPGTGTGRTDWELHADRYYETLVAGRPTEATALVRKVVADGAAAGEVYLRVLTPALHRIGEEWAAGRLTVADEHRATEITAAILVRLGDHFRRRGPSRGSAITLTPPGEDHGLGSMMAADFLRAAGYEVHHLGPNVPVLDLGMFLDVTPVEVVCLSITMPSLDPGVLADIVATTERIPGARVVVGGQGVDPTLAAQAGAVPVGSLSDLAPSLETVAAH